MAISRFSFLREGQGYYGTFCRKPTDYVDARVLAANVEETHTVPSGAKICIFSSNGDFYARPNDTAAVPGADVSDGTASELNPAVWDVANVTSIHLIAPASTVVTMSFYNT